MTSAQFLDRTDAGRRLADRLVAEGVTADVILGLPRGGMPVAREVALRLHRPLDVLVVRKLGFPGHPELAVGAIGEDGVHVLNEALLSRYPVPGGALAAVENAERSELDRRVRQYRRGRDKLSITDNDVIVVDDGIATGSTMLAAIEVLRGSGAASVIVAAPVASRQAADALARRADRLVILSRPRLFGAVGTFYDDFTQLSDRDVTEILSGV